MNIDFETIWKENWSVFPEMPNKWEDREVFKVVAKRIFNDLEREMQMREKYANEEGYKMGYEEGYDVCASKSYRAIKDLKMSVEDLAVSVSHQLSHLLDKND